MLTSLTYVRALEELNFRSRLAWCLNRAGEREMGICSLGVQSVKPYEYISETNHKVW